MPACGLCPSQPAANAPPPQRPPGPQLLFPQRGLSGSGPLGTPGLRLRSAGNLWAQRDETGTRRLRPGPDPASPGGPRAPPSSPDGNPARLGTGAGGTANVGLGKVCHLTGRKRRGEPPLGEARREGGFPESGINGTVMLAAQAPGCSGLAISSARFPGVGVGF